MARPSVSELCIIITYTKRRNGNGKEKRRKERKGKEKIKLLHNQTESLAFFVYLCVAEMI